MDPMLPEDPDARPKQLVMLAASGIAVATIFATTAAMVAGAQQHDEATPDFTLKPTATSRPADTYTTPPLLPPPPPSSSATSETSTTASRTTSSTTLTSTEIPGDFPVPPPPEPPTPPTRPTTTPTKPPTTSKPIPTTTTTTEDPVPTDTTEWESSGEDA
ncbi:hypothetical protein [Saccharopolyspora elongata]|uniref:Uncharacterized protein n=1 Tax=Saccharopolyspora elongata TaxID=2530387 RepID=A0A4R4Z3I4_9PSEU|nr:hypothetical protein [Saccharopolyspora elongata]TDD51980.1 hypothetical protein E1288_13460 [Saccharopolyspora elongata]